MRGPYSPTEPLQHPDNPPNVGPDPRHLYTARICHTCVRSKPCAYANRVIGENQCEFYTIGLEPERPHTAPKAPQMRPVPTYCDKCGALLETQDKWSDGTGYYCGKCFQALTGHVTHPPAQPTALTVFNPAAPGPSMTRAEFDKLIAEDLNTYIAGLRDEKEAEYANKGDTLLNFHRMGPFYGLTPAQYCLILLGKHVQGIANQVMSGKWKWAYRTEDGGEGLKQRIADGKNYFDLLFALLSEEAAAREETAHA